MSAGVARGIARPGQPVVNPRAGIRQSPQVSISGPIAIDQRLPVSGAECLKSVCLIAPVDKISHWSARAARIPRVPPAFRPSRLFPHKMTCPIF